MIEPHTISIGDVYRDSRNNEPLKLVYLDRTCVLLQTTGDMHRLCKRNDFERQVTDGRYKPVEDDGVFSESPLTRLQELAERYESGEGYKSSNKAEALREALELLTEDANDDDAEDIPFESLDGIGEKGAANLRKAGYVTKGDVRRANEEELLDVSWVGEKGVESLIDYV